MAYLQSDLGKTSLFDLITKRADKTTWAPELVNLLERTISELPKLQWLGGKGLDYSKCHPVPEMNHQAVMWDLNYFKYCFLKTTGLEFREDKLEDDFRKLSKILLENTSDTFMFRDFQSRNVMIKEGNPYFIDFSRQDDADHGNTTLYHFYGKPKRAFPRVCANTLSKPIFRPPLNSQKPTVPRHGTHFPISYYSEPFRYSEHMDFAVM